MIARRILWATMPYYGWIEYDGAAPCPWWAHPLAWVHRLTWWWMGRRGEGMFGPRFNAFSYRYPEPPPRPWE